MSLSIASSRMEIAARYQAVRDFSCRLTETLTPEDCMVQSMVDTSPTRWHLAHTTWFFETFVLAEQAGFRPFDEHFRVLFNSYYNSVGKQFPRPQRGVISRPGLDRIRAYRTHVDQAMNALLLSEDVNQSTLDAIIVGLHHEQQHQELILTDIKHALSCNPILPTFRPEPLAPTTAAALHWFDVLASTCEVGSDGTAFCFDNELPRHTTFLQDHSIARSLVTCGDYINFINDGGYSRAELWLSAGFEEVRRSDWDAPLYWVRRDSRWMVFTLAGLVPVEDDWPVCHVSYFEAEAFARWSGHRLPTEFEWENAANSNSAPNSNSAQFVDALVESGHAIHPTQAASVDRHDQTRQVEMLLGSVWEWTSSSYGPYPGYRPLAGAMGEYNGKFMCNQYVLRGGSVATHSGHIRNSYRNFFPPDARWQFSGIRLAR